MRDRMERLVLLPFSIGCVSESSVAVAVHHRGHHPRRSSKSPPPSSSAAAAHNQNLSPIRDGDEDEESSLSSESTKNSYRLMAVSKPDISAGFNRFFKGFKNFSQMFVYKDEDSEEEDEEIEIGLPTDVKHVTHIGIDGSSAINNNNNNIVDPINGWDDLLSSPDHHHLLGPVSFQQFKLSSMADPATLVRD